MLNLGTVKPGSTIYIPFDTFAGSTGASITMTGLATTDILIYKNGGITERASQTGYTLLDTDGIDFDAKTGIHGFSIDLSSNADAGFYVCGADYVIVVSTITIDSQTVSFVAARFTIGCPDATINTTIATLSTQTSFTLTAGPAEDNALNGCQVMIHDIASAIQMSFGLITAYTGSTKTVTLAAAPTFTVAAGDNICVFKPVLLPTTAGRTLDVSSTGEAGVDWANIGSPTTTQNLSGTSTKAIEPTVAGRTLDITATGEAGIDWANIGSPTASQPDVNVEKWNATLVPAEHTVGYPIVTIKDGTGTGEIDTASGAVVQVNQLGTQAKADVNAEVVDALNVDTYAEPGQEAPGATVSLVKKIGYLYKAFRNKITQTSTTMSLFADNETTVDQKATVSDNGTTFTKGEIGTGP